MSTKENSNSKKKEDNDKQTSDDEPFVPHCVRIKRLLALKVRDEIPVQVG